MVLKSGGPVGDPSVQSLGTALVAALDRQPAVIAALLAPQLAALAAVVNSHALVRATVDRHADAEEVKQLRALAVHVCRLGDGSLKSLWMEYVLLYGLTATRRAFGVVPREFVEPIFLSLRAKLTEARSAPITRVTIKRSTFAQRYANPREDLDSKQVVEKLSIHGIDVDPSDLAGPMGLYDVLGLQPLRKRSPRTAADREASYLDEHRYETLEGVCVNSATLVQHILMYIHAIPEVQRAAIKAGRKRVSGWDYLKSSRTGRW